MALHEYSVTDSSNADEHLKIAYRLAVAAGGLGVVTAWLIGLISTWGLSTALSAPSTILIYQLLVKWFAKYLWRTRIGRIVGVTTPDLNGIWRGTVNFRTRNDQQLENDTGRMTIEQQWRRIGIRFETDKTLSDSLVASVVIEANQAKIIYQYKTDKRRPDRDDSVVHTGTGTIRVNRNADDYVRDTMEITYYTDHRETGSIRLAISPQS